MNDGQETSAGRTSQPGLAGCRRHALPGRQGVGLLRQATDAPQQHPDRRGAGRPHPRTARVARQAGARARDQLDAQAGDPARRHDRAVADRDARVDKTTYRQTHTMQLRPGQRPRRRGRRRPGRVRADLGRAQDHAAPHRQRRRGPAQPALPVRELRHRLVQPVRPCRSRRCRRGTRQGIQPARDPRRVRTGQDPPAARDRPLRPQPLPLLPGALRQQRGVHERRHQRDP